MTPPAERANHVDPFRAGPSRRWVLRTAGLALASGGAVRVISLRRKELGHHGATAVGADLCDVHC